MGTRLYVGNLSYNVTEPELRDVFAEGGRNVVEVKIVMDRDTGRPRGFAFVEMGSDDEATQAIQSLTGREIQGRAINVSEARARAPRSGGFGGGGGGYGGGGYGGGGGGGGGYGGGGGGRGRGGYGEGGGRGGGDYGEGRGRSRRGGW
jgi:RNA recognition motif-containing protein